MLYAKKYVDKKSHPKKPVLNLFKMCFFLYKMGYAPEFAMTAFTSCFIKPIWNND